MATAVAPAPQAQQPADVELMEFAVDRNQLLTEVAAAARVFRYQEYTAASFATFSFVLAEAAFSSITGSDLQRTVTTECPAAIKTFGEATVPAQKLLNYLKLLPEGRVA